MPSMKISEPGSCSRRRSPAISSILGSFRFTVWDETPTAALITRCGSFVVIVERMGRWLRQHQAWTPAAVAARVGISVAATIAAVVVLRRQLSNTCFRVGDHPESTLVSTRSGVHSAQTIWEQLASAGPVNDKLRRKDLPTLRQNPDSWAL